MARMNREEQEAAVAKATWEGARTIAQLVSKMTDLGLSLAAVAGALEAQVKELGEKAVDAESKAIDSRAKEPAAE